MKFEHQAWSVKDLVELYDAKRFPEARLHSGNSNSIP